MVGKAESISWSLTGGLLGISFGNDQTVLLKPTEDGSYGEVLNVNETGLTGSFAEGGGGDFGATPSTQLTPQQQAGVKIETLKEPF